MTTTLNASTAGAGGFIATSDNSGVLALQTAGTTAITVDTSQRIGIGGTPSAWSASPFSPVMQFGSTGTVTSVSGANGSLNLFNNCYYNGSNYIYQVTDYATRYATGNGGNHIWYYAPSGTAGNAITFTEAMRIDSSGNVGIGTSSPSNKLSVAGGIEITATGFNGSGNGIWLYTTNSLGFVTGGTNRAVINSSGNLLIKCTANPSASVYGSGFIDNGVGASVLYQSTSITSANALQVFYNPNGNVGSVGTSGSNAYYSTTSDYRLKENITPMTGALAKVAQLKPVNYKWKADGSDGEGFIAHELAEVCPHAVVGNKDAVDADGNPVYQSIDTSFLVATLTAALQETKALIDTQAETINALTARIVALESK
jgi:hypothetical protein